MAMQRNRQRGVCAALHKVGLGLMLGLGGWSWAQAPAGGQPPALAWSQAQLSAAGVRVQVLQPSRDGVSAGLVLSGTVVAPPQAVRVLAAPLTAVVQEALVGVGQPVRPGEALARLRSPQLLEWQRELLQAQTQAEAAATRLRRDERLLAEGIVAEARVQDARSQHRLAQLTLAERRQALQASGVPDAPRGLNAGLTLRADQPATVLEVLAAPGQRLEAGAPVLRLLRGGLLSIELQADPQQAARLRVGDALQVEGCAAPARVAAIAPQLNMQNQSVLVRADLRGDTGCVRIHQFVRATLAAGGAAAPLLRVPIDAVVQQGGQSYVFVRRPQGFVPTAVRLAAPGGGAARVVEQGLQAGDAVAVGGTAALKGAWQGLGRND